MCASGCMTIGNIIDALEEEGILFWRDARFKKSQESAVMIAGSEDKTVTVIRECHLVGDTFTRFICPRAILFLAAFSKKLVIPDWSSFGADITHLFEKIKHIESGENAQCIPIFRDANHSKIWGLSTLDLQH